MDRMVDLEEVAGKGREGAGRSRRRGSGQRGSRPNRGSDGCASDAGIYPERNSPSDIRRTPRRPAPASPPNWPPRSRPFGPAGPRSSSLPGRRAASWASSWPRSIRSPWFALPQCGTQRAQPVVRRAAGAGGPEGGGDPRPAASASPSACGSVPNPDQSEAAPAKPRRMSDSSIKADRLREFRAKDPALDTAADALDLEIVD